MGVEVKLLHRFTGHAAGLYAMSLHNNGRSFYSGGSDKILTSWSLEKKDNEKFQASFPNIIYSTAILPGEKEIVVGTFSGDLHIVDLKERKEVRMIKTHTAGIFDLSQAEGTNKLVAASGDGSISFSPVLKKFAVAAGDGSVRIFDERSLKEENKIEAHKLSANCVHWDPSGKYLISGGRDAFLRIWETSNYKMLMEIAAHNFALYSIAFHPDGHLFATASRDKTIRIWDAALFRPLITLDLEKFQGHKNSVNRLVWSNFENILLSCADDRTIIAWKVEMI